MKVIRWNLPTFPFRNPERAKYWSACIFAASAALTCTWLKANCRRENPPSFPVIRWLARSKNAAKALGGFGQARAWELRGFMARIRPANTAGQEWKISATIPSSPATPWMEATRSTPWRWRILYTRFRKASTTNRPLLCSVPESSASAACGFRGIKKDGRLALYGFGAAGHVAIQVARHWGAEVYAATRGKKHQELARKLGAVWVGEAAEAPPDKIDAAIMFAPAGELVPPALKALKKAGVLVLGGIHMSPIPEFGYDLLYEERVIRSVANNTRNDGKDFLRVAAEIPIRSEVTLFPLRDANRALNDLKADRINGAAVLDCRS